MATEKEAIYDAQISPLMQQVIAICKEHKIAVLCDFALGFDEEHESELKCTTALLGDEFEPPKEMLAAFDHVSPKKASFCAFMISSGGL